MRLLLVFLCFGFLVSACNDGDAPPNFTDAGVHQDGSAAIDMHGQD